MNDSTWTWIAGSTTVNQTGVYGVKGHASTSNVPRARHLGLVWYDEVGQEVWLFGGLSDFPTNSTP